VKVTFGGEEGERERDKDRERERLEYLWWGAATARLVDSKPCTGRVLGLLLQNKSCSQGVEKRGDLHTGMRIFHNSNIGVYSCKATGATAQELQGENTVLLPDLGFW